MSQEELDEVVAQILNGLTTVIEAMSERLSIAEQTIESLDKQVAALMFSVGEGSVIIEALVRLVTHAPEEHQDEFKASIKDLRSGLVDTLRGHVRTMAEQDSDFAEAVAGLADEQPADPE